MDEDSIYNRAFDGYIRNAIEKIHRQNSSGDIYETPIKDITFVMDGYEHFIYPAKSGDGLIFESKDPSFKDRKIASAVLEKDADGSRRLKTQEMDGTELWQLSTISEIVSLELANGKKINHISFNKAK